MSWPARPLLHCTFDVILDIVSGPLVPSFIDRLAPNGRMIAVGAVAGPPDPGFGTALLAGFQRSISYGTFSLATVPVEDRIASSLIHATRRVGA